MDLHQSVADLVEAMMAEHIGHTVMFQDKGKPRAGVLKRVSRSVDDVVVMWIDCGPGEPVKITPDYATGCSCSPRRRI